MKKIKIFIVSILIFIIVFTFVGCKKDVSNEDGETKDLVVAEGLSAYSLASEAYGNWKSNTFQNYKRVEEETISLGLGTIGVKKVRQIYKVDGNNINSEKVTIGTSLLGGNRAVKHEFRSTYLNKYSVKANSLIPAKDPDIYAVTDWGPATKYTAEKDIVTINEERLSVKYLAALYNLDSKSFLTEDSNDVVYYYGDSNSTYVCNITLDMSDAAIVSNQPKARNELCNKFDEEATVYEVKPVQMKFIVEKYGETYRLLKWEYNQEYKVYARIGDYDCVHENVANFAYSEREYKIY